MAKLKCPCGIILSNTRSSNKVNFICFNDNEDSSVDVWVCTCGEWVNVDNVWYKKEDRKNY